MRHQFSFRSIVIFQIMLIMLKLSGLVAEKSFPWYAALSPAIFFSSLFATNFFINLFIEFLKKDDQKRLKEDFFSDYSVDELRQYGFANINQYCNFLSGMKFEYIGQKYFIKTPMEISYMCNGSAQLFSFSVIYKYDRSTNRSYFIPLVSLIQSSNEESFKIPVEDLVFFKISEPLPAESISRIRKRVLSNS